MGNPNRNPNKGLSGPEKSPFRRFVGFMGSALAKAGQSQGGGGARTAHSAEALGLKPSNFARNERVRDINRPVPHNHGGRGQATAGGRAQAAAMAHQNQPYQSKRNDSLKKVGAMAGGKVTAAENTKKRIQMKNRATGRGPATPTAGSLRTAKNGSRTQTGQTTRRSSGAQMKARDKWRSAVPSTGKRMGVSARNSNRSR